MLSYSLSFTQHISLAFFHMINRGAARARACAQQRVYIDGRSDCRWLPTIILSALLAACARLKVSWDWFPLCRRVTCFEALSRLQNRRRRRSVSLSQATPPWFTSDGHCLIDHIFPPIRLNYYRHHHCGFHFSLFPGHIVSSCENELARISQLTRPRQGWRGRRGELPSEESSSWPHAFFPAMYACYFQIKCTSYPYIYRLSDCFTRCLLPLIFEKICDD